MTLRVRKAARGKALPLKGARRTGNGLRTQAKRLIDRKSLLLCHDESDLRRLIADATADY